MQITFVLPHVFGSKAEATDNALALQALLDCLIALNSAFLRNHDVRPLYRAGVRYGRTLEWDTIPALYARGYGDCKSLTAALVAEYRKEGIAARPVFRFQPNSRGGNDFHILVQTRKGFEDPSKVLGMGSDESRWFR